MYLLKHTAVLSLMVFWGLVLTVAGKGGGGGGGRGGGGFGGGRGGGGGGRGYSGARSASASRGGGVRSSGGFRSGGAGSASRATAFKSSVVGGGAGASPVYRGYHGGSTFIFMSPMMPLMWGGRPYYWGSSYYRPQPGYDMCRMPVDPNDEIFRKVYLSNSTEILASNGTELPSEVADALAANSAMNPFDGGEMEAAERPKEIVWPCAYNEECCGYECCDDEGSGVVIWALIGIAALIGLCVFANEKFKKAKEERALHGRRQQPQAHYVATGTGSNVKI